MPSTRPDNLRRLDAALERSARSEQMDSELALDEAVTGAQPVIELTTDHGEVKVVPTPAGTRGYDDLRRAANREPLGRGVRPSVASIGDLARMASALGREQHLARAQAASAPRRARAQPQSRSSNARRPSQATDPRLPISLSHPPVVSLHRTQPVGATYPASGRMFEPLPLEEHWTIWPLPSQSAT